MGLMFILPFFIHLQIKKRGLVGSIECAIFWRFCRRLVFCEVPILIITSHLGTLSFENDWKSFSSGDPSLRSTCFWTQWKSCFSEIIPYFTAPSVIHVIWIWFLPQMLNLHSYLKILYWRFTFEWTYAPKNAISV